MANEPTVDKSQLLGTWQLESWSIGYAGRDDVSFPFGEDPVGLLLYTEDDWMSVSISRRERAVLPADVRSGASMRSVSPVLSATISTMRAAIAYGAMTSCTTSPRA
jgi:hypothetical protein